MYSKRLNILLISLLCFAAARAQIPVFPLPVGSPYINQQMPRLQVRLSFGVPLWSDTTSPLVNAPDSLGMIIQIRATGKQYKRDTLLTGGHFWNLIGAGSSVAPSNTPNEYWNGYEAFAGLNTDSVTEGASNKFFHSGDTAGFKYRSDSSANNPAAFTTQASRQKAIDSLNALIALRRLISDSSGTTSPMSRGATYNSIDSLAAIIAGKQPAGSYLTAPVANSSLATMTANTVKSNLTGSTAAPADNTVGAIAGAVGAYIGNTPGGGFPLWNVNLIDIRELFQGTNITIDSTTHAGGYTINSSGGSGIAQIYAKLPLTISGTDTVVADTTIGHVNALATIAKLYAALDSAVGTLSSLGNDRTHAGTDSMGVFTGGSSALLKSFTLTSAGATVAVTDNTDIHGLSYNLEVVGGGGDAITSPNTSLTVGGTSANTTLDLNLAYAPTLTGAWTFGATNTTVKNLIPSANVTYNLGSSGAAFNNVYSANFLAPGNMAFSIGSGDNYKFNINGGTDFEVASTGQLVAPQYTSTTSFTLGSPVGALVFDASGNIGTAAIGSQNLQQVFNAGSVFTKPDTVHQAGNALVLSGGGQVHLDSMNLTNIPLFTGNTIFFDVLGDSYFACYRPQSPDTCVITQIETKNNFTINNLAVGSMGIDRMDSVFNYHVNTTSPTSLAYGMISMIGLNDYRRGGWAPKTNAKVSNGYNALFVNQYMKNFVAGGATATGLTRYGGTTGYQGQSVCGKTNNGWLSNTLHDSITYAFTDSTVFWTTIGTDSSYGASNYSESVLVYIDNVQVGVYHLNNQTDGLNDGVYDNRRSPMAFWYNGLTYGAHTLKIVNNTAHSYYLPVDCIGSLLDKSNALPWVLFEIPHLTASGYAASPNLANNTVINEANSTLDSNIATWPPWYPVKIAKTNTYYGNSPLDYANDSIHPFQPGDNHIYQGFTATITAANAAPFSFLSVNGIPYWVTANGALSPLAIGSSPNYIANGTTPQTANLNITGTAVANSFTAPSANIGSLITQNSAAFIAGTTPGGSPFHGLYNSAAGTDNKYWGTYIDATTYNFQIGNDALTSFHTYLQGARSGNSVTGLTAYVPLSLTPASGTALLLTPLANTSVISLTGAVTGFSKINLAPTASTGFQLEVGNASSASGAYADVYIKNGNTSTSGSSTVDYSGPIDIWTGLNNVDSSYNVYTGSAFYNGFTGGTNLLKVSKTGKAFFYDSVSLAARAGYNTNLGSTFTAHSLIDKNYDDSARAAAIASAIAGITSGTLFAQTANGTAVTNSTSLTNLLGTGVSTPGLTVAANTMAVGQTYIMHGNFTYTETGTPTLEFNWLIGGTGSSFNPALNPSSTQGEITITYTVLSTGSSGTVEYNVRVDNQGSNPVYATPGTLTINTTASVTLGLQVAWSAASSSNSIQSVPSFILRQQ